MRVERPVFNPPNYSGHCSDSIQSGDEQTIALPPGSRCCLTSHIPAACCKHTNTHALTSRVALQACVAGEAGVFRERTELHDPSHPASLLVRPGHREPVHAHRLGTHRS